MALYKKILSKFTPLNDKHLTRIYGIAPTPNSNPKAKEIKK